MIGALMPSAGRGAELDVLDDGPFCEAPCLAAPGRAVCGADGRVCLIEAASHGNRPAQELLFSSLYAPVRSQARRLCGKPVDAEDLTQLALLSVYRKLHQLRDRSRLLGWTRQVVRTTHLMSRRRSQFAPAGGEETILNDLELACPACAIDRAAEAREALCFTLGRLRRLSPCLRDVVELRAFQHKSTAQTARTLRISNAAVRTRLKRAREALRQLPIEL